MFLGGVYSIPNPILLINVIMCPQFYGDIDILEFFDVCGEG